MSIRDKVVTALTKSGHQFSDLHEIKDIDARIEQIGRNTLKDGGVCGVVLEHNHEKIAYYVERIEKRFPDIGVESGPTEGTVDIRIRPRNQLEVFVSENFKKLPPLQA